MSLKEATSKMANLVILNFLGSIKNTPLMTRSQKFLDEALVSGAKVKYRDCLAAA